MANQIFMRVNEVAEELGVRVFMFRWKDGRKHLKFRFKTGTY